MRWGKKMKKEKLMVIGAIFVVGILLAGSYFYLHRVPKLQVSEGNAEFRYSINNTSICMIEKNISAVTIINNGSGIINLTVEPISRLVELENNDENKVRNIEIPIYVYLTVHMPSNIVPAGFRIVAQETEKSNSTVDFLESYNRFENSTPWPSDENWPGAWAPHPAFIGGTPQKSSFGLVTLISWIIMDSMVLKTHTLKITAEILGFSTPVVATIVFTIDTSALTGLGA